MRGLMTAFAFAMLSCQGPWSYWPDGSEDYRGIWIYAYIIAGRPVENVCFDKMHALDEVRMPRFAFYEIARVKISGVFRDIRYYDDEYAQLYLYAISDKPNCFYGPEALLAVAGESYELEATIAWDSAGAMVTSSFSAKTHIPEKFEIKRAYDLEGNLHINNRKEGDGYYNNFLYLPPPMDLKSSYFIPEYGDDVGGVLVSMVYDSDVLWGENSIVGMIDNAIDQFSPGYDTALYARFGDREIIFFARNKEIAGMGKDIDSIPVIGLAMPGSGRFDLIFYAATDEYAKFRDTYINGANDSRIKPIYNIKGGAGIFAGMLADTFSVHIKPSQNDIKLYPYGAAQDWYCGTKLPFSGEEYSKTRKECIKYWDYDMHWNYDDISSMEELVMWCKQYDFQLYGNYECGVAMVYYYREMGGKSSVLEREAKRWCEGHKGSSVCAGL